MNKSLETKQIISTFQQFIQSSIHEQSNQLVINESKVRRGVIIDLECEIVTLEKPDRTAGDSVASDRDIPP